MPVGTRSTFGTGGLAQPAGTCTIHPLSRDSFFRAAMRAASILRVRSQNRIYNYMYVLCIDFDITKMLFLTLRRYRARFARKSL